MPARFGPTFSGAGGGGGALIVATRSDNSNPAVFSNFAALETYTATPDGTTDAAAINVTVSTLARQVFAVGTLNAQNQVTAITAAYIRLNGDWVSVATNLVGTPGQDGQDGSGTDFSGITANHIPAIGSDGRPFDSGLQIDDGDFITPRSIQAGPGSLRLGPQFTMSSGVDAVALTLGGGQAALGVNVEYGDDGTVQPFYYKLGTTTDLNINTTQDTDIADPFTFQYTTVGDNLTRDFQVIPAEAGELRVRFWQGTDQTGVLIFDENRTFEQADVNTIQTFGVGNPYIFAAGTPLFVRFEGIQLRGGTGGPNDLLTGQSTIYFVSQVAPFTKVEFLTADSTPPAQDPRITSFNIAGQSAVVDAGTQLTGQVTFNYNVENPDEVDGTGTITQAGTSIATGVSATLTTVTATLNDITLAAGQSVVFTLSFTADSGAMVTRDFTVRARTPAETLYYGTMATNVPDTVDTSTLTTQDVRAGTTFDADFALDNTHYAVILSPADREITAITERTFNAPILTDFTKTENVRTISGQSYDAYVHQNNSGATATLATTITVS